MNKDRPSNRALAGILIFTLSCFLLLMFLWRTFGGEVPLTPQGYRVNALYKEAVLLPVEADVRISGVGVGSVKSVTRDGNLSKVVLQIDPQFAPLPADTKTVIRRKTLLGEAYVELSPGTPPSRGGKMLGEGSTLPLSSSKDTVELDEFLRVFDARTRKSVQAVLKELAVATYKEGPNLSAASAALGPAFSDANQLAQILNGQRSDVRGLVRDSGQVLDAFTSQPGALRSLVQNSDQILQATAQQDKALTETVRIFPTFLDELDPTLRLARDVGREADPLLDELRPAVNDLPATLRNLRATAPDVKGLSGDLDTLIDTSRQGLPALRRTLVAAGPLVDQLEPALQDLVPAVQVLRMYKLDVITGFSKLAAAVQSTAGGVHELRSIIALKPEGLGIYPSKLPSNRHNAYPKPGNLNEVGSPQIDAFDCLNAGDSPLPAPKCTDQGKYHLEGRSTSFPQIHRAPVP
ncbi:MAG: phospholipid/cholesterol/gamma-HCH transport system substrate-binding protein [Thermoleophilaceae bacterium]|jgi:virulence factor Mce-like protein|nr:phospholipid/cholesterol/gamma-HCH transport system substrate-binding protein [Thermoleophilaceae bacterium]